MDPNKSLWIDNSDGMGAFRNPDITDAEFEEGIAAMKDANLNALWQKATEYQSSFISDAAFGLVTKGSIKGFPKCLAVEAWINSIWALYYQRKALVTYQWNDALYDFSSVGAMPYMVPDLMAEVYN